MSSDEENSMEGESDYNSDSSVDDGPVAGGPSSKCLPTPARDAPPREGNPLVFMDIEIGAADDTDKSRGRVVFELFADKVPRTAENFRSLCVGDNKKKLRYKGSIFHRVIKKFMIQGGDFENANGTGGESIYGLKFDDEGLSEEPFRHDKAGLLSMANSGPNTNGSQFFVTVARAAHLDGKHVVFGRVLKGLGLVKAVEKVDKGADDRPKFDVVVAECGEFPAGTTDFKLIDGEGAGAAVDGDVFPTFPEDSDLDFSLEKNLEEVLETAGKVKAAGNKFYKAKDFRMAAAKYRKALRYVDCLRDAVGSTDDGQETKVRAVELPLVLNVAAVMVALKRWDEAKKECNKVLEIDDSHSKALFRRGQAHLGKQDFDLALTDLRKVTELEPNDKGVLNEIARVKKAKLDYNAREKKLYSKMFG